MHFGIPPGWVKVAERVYTTGTSTWTINARTYVVDVECIGTGASGAGGPILGTLDSGGSGGGAGARFRRRFLAPTITSSVTVTVQSPPGTTAPGSAGTQGGYAAFGSYITAYGGGGPGDADTAYDGGAGGGPMGAGPFNPNSVTGGAPGSGAGNHNPGFGGAGGNVEGGSGTFAPNAASSVWGGAAGGTGSSTVQGDVPGGRSVMGPGGGGAGGWHGQTTADAGGKSSPWTSGDATTTGGGAAGGTGTAGAAGTAGTAGDGFHAGGGGGGGAPNTSGGAGGDGGAGGYPGGGGGGGGDNTNFTNGGHGGAGGAGQVRVIEWAPPLASASTLLTDDISRASSGPIAQRKRSADPDAAPLAALSTASLLSLFGGEHIDGRSRRAAPRAIEETFVPVAMAAAALLSFGGLSESSVARAASLRRVAEEPSALSPLGRLALQDQDQIQRASARARRAPDDFLPLGTIQQPVATFLGEEALSRRSRPGQIALEQPVAQSRVVPAALDADAARWVTVKSRGGDDPFIGLALSVAPTLRTSLDAEPQQLRARGQQRVQDDFLPLGTIQQRVATFVDEDRLPRRSLVRVRTDDGFVLAALRLGDPLSDELPARASQARHAQADDGAPLSALAAPPALLEHLQGEHPRPRPWVTQRPLEPPTFPAFVPAALGSYVGTEQPAATRQSSRWRADDGIVLPPLLRPFVDSEAIPPRRWASASRPTDGSHLPALAVTALRSYLDAEVSRLPQRRPARPDDPGHLPALALSISLRGYLDSDTPGVPQRRPARPDDPGHLPALGTYAPLREYLESEQPNRTRFAVRQTPLDPQALRPTVPPAIQAYLDVDAPQRQRVAGLIPQQQDPCVPRAFIGISVGPATAVASFVAFSAQVISSVAFDASQPSVASFDVR